MTNQARDPNAIEHYDDDSRVYLDSYSGGASPQGAWGTLRLRFVAPDGTETVRHYTANGPARPYPVENDPQT